MREKALFFTEPNVWEHLSIIPALEIVVEPGEMSNSTVLNITHWEMLDFNEEFIWVQLHF